MLLYKLTLANGKTKGGVLWGPGIINKPTSGDGPLCSNAWYHVYTDPLLAILLDPIHGCFGSNAKLFSCEGRPQVFDPCSGTLTIKAGVTSLRFISWLELPQISFYQKIIFGILCAKEVYKDSNFMEWADDWILNKDRSLSTAYSIYFDISNKLEKLVNSTDNNIINHYSVLSAAHATKAAAYASNNSQGSAIDVAYACNFLARAAYFKSIPNGECNIDLPKLARKAITY